MGDIMKALITGASSGIGRDLARLLSLNGYDLILVARREENLLKLKEEFKTNVQIIALDLSKEENCIELYKTCENQDIDLLVNNAGFGLFAPFCETNLNDELEMIKTNDIAPHILTKLFLQKFMKIDKGHILNVCSSASFYPGPLMATYYASKAYLYRLSLGIHQELKKKHSKVHISVLCPGPVATEFQAKADVKFTIKAISSEKVARIAFKDIKKHKLIITPTFTMKAGKFLSRFVSEKMMLKIAYHYQVRKK